MIRTGVGGHGNHFVIVDGLTPRMGRQVVVVRNPWGYQYVQDADEFSEVNSGWALVVKGVK